ncbi:MAG TPA: DMT family transporter [Pseudomonadales bacterium]|jgi:drug/metabolite transporter (DMT)-like permease|nr:DMT family transporter [Pseudomonadales bacterium]MDP6314853.1 DMT family transporter [Pseudomonadales bacterium]MDP7313745.1 DMT family transporter [Pseudomonadales bacterium]HJL61711.1 DMT family transporter [Pseudomonadales bacterium]HJP51228.1 DMT family transporter [Pseudomonadales bacterium]|tara:strand:- start:9296 stop:10198 length:903 start_codon:yes stop_codon:yes gene_type:complete
MNRKDHIDTLGAVLLISMSVILGLNQVFVKIVNDGLQPVFQAGLRSFFGLFLVLVYALLMRKRLSIGDGSFWPGMLSGLFFTAEFILLFEGLDRTTVSRASIMFYIMPVWVAIAAHFLIPGEKLTLIRVLGLILAISGVAVALVVNNSGTTEGTLAGDLLCLSASLFWAGIALVARISRLSQSIPEMQLLYQLVVSSIVMLAIAPFFGELVRDLTPTIVFIFSLQVILVVCISFLVWFWILSIYPASDMASFSFLTPVFGVLFGWLILGDELTYSILAALILVGIGITLVNYKPRDLGPE